MSSTGKQIKNPGETPPLSSNDAAGEEVFLAPLHALKSRLSSRGDYAEIEGEVLFTGSVHYVIYERAIASLQLFNEYGVRVSESENAAGIIQFLDQNNKTNWEENHD